VMNENYAHAALPAGVEEGILRGMYFLRSSPLSPRGRGAGGEGALARVQLLGSGTILREVLAAAELLEKDWNVAADVWSVTSFTELRRDGMAVERFNRRNLSEPQKLSFVEQCLGDTGGPVIAASDYLRSVADMIRTWVPRRYVTLGTDGYGRSDTRAALRSFFEVDRANVVIAALKALADDGTIERGIVARSVKQYAIDPGKPNPWDS
jgi:pyruvate dehydrogenase E1 component